MAQIRWSLTAGNDLQDIEDFIARDSVLHAITFVDRIVESAENAPDWSNRSRVHSPRPSRSDLQMAHEIFSHSSAVNPGKLAVSVSEIASSWNHAQRRRRRSGDTDLQRQPRISDLLRGKIELFSVDTLITMLTHAGLKVDVRVRRSAAA